MLNVLHAAALSFSSRPPTVAVASPRVASASVKMATDLSVDLTRPSYLDGTLAADSGFDPLRLTAKYRQGLKLSLMLNPETSLPFSTATAACKPTDVFLGPNTHDEAKALIWFRESEIKHARLAMLAAVGWPLAELWHGGLSRLSGGQYLLDVTHGRSLSVLNGGLGEVLPFLVLATLGAAFVECSTLDQVLLPTTCFPRPPPLDHTTSRLRTLGWLALRSRRRVSGLAHTASCHHSLQPPSPTRPGVRSPEP